MSQGNSSHTYFLAPSQKPPLSKKVAEKVGMITYDIDTADIKKKTWQVIFFKLYLFVYQSFSPQFYKFFGGRALFSEGGGGIFYIIYLFSTYDHVTGLFFRYIFGGDQAINGHFPK